MSRKFKVTVNGEVFDVEIETANSSTSEQKATKKIENKPAPIPEAATTASTKEPVMAEPRKEPKKESVVTNGSKVVAAPLPGKILSVKVKKGSSVKKGDLLLILEAMKMENEIYSSQDGTITDILVSAGDYVSTGDKLIVME